MAQQRSDSPSPATTPPKDDWSAVTDLRERRRIQNRIAQRRFREKKRQNGEEAERAAENQRQASGSYAAPEPEDVDCFDEPGLPWGSFSFRHVVAAGKVKEQSSRESSAQGGWASQAGGGSSRLGLHLIDIYARGSPAWAAWRARVAPFAMHQNRSTTTPGGGINHRQQHELPHFEQQQYPMSSMADAMVRYPQHHHDGATDTSSNGTEAGAGAQSNDGDVHMIYAL